MQNYNFLKTHERLLEKLKRQTELSNQINIINIFKN